MAARGRISRRDFFKLSLTCLGGALLAACRAQRPDPPASLTLTTSTSAAPLPTLTPRPTQPVVASATPLMCTRLLTPQDGAKLGAAGRITFSWEPMPDATLYWLELTLPTGQTLTFDSTGPHRDQYLESFNMRGMYFWQISALDHGGGLLCTSERFMFEKGE